MSNEEPSSNGHSNGHSPKPPDLAETGGQPPERDERGRFLPGHVGYGGRPLGVDFKSLVRRERGETVEEKVLAIYDQLVTKAVSGDLKAAKLLFDHLLDKEALRVEFPGSELSDIDRAARLTQILEAAERRRQEAEGQANNG